MHSYPNDHMNNEETEETDHDDGNDEYSDVNGRDRGRYGLTQYIPLLT